MKTQKQKIMRHLIKYGSITRNEAIGIYSITRLAEYMRQLKAEGVTVIREYLGKNKADYRYTVSEDHLDMMRSAKQAKEFADTYGIPIFPSVSRTMPEMRVQ